MGEGHESAQLDYKGRCDLRERRELVAITKDIGAMNVLGGYIVIGADDRGQPTGQVTAHDVQAFDQANLQSKLRRYLPDSVEVRTAAHLDDNTVIVMYVAARPDGFVVFDADGTYAGNDGRERFEFRAGEVFARHGTASEWWTQADIVRIRQGLRDRERERWRLEFREDLDATLGAATTARNVAEAPAAVLDWRLDEQTLVGALIEQIRGDDLIPPRTSHDAAARRSARRHRCGRSRAAGPHPRPHRRNRRHAAAGPPDRPARPRHRGAGPDLQRRLRRPGHASRWTSASLGHDLAGHHPPRVRDRCIRRTPARLGRGRNLTLQTGSGYDWRDDYYKTWLRHGLTMAARAGLLGVEPDRRGESISLIILALQDIDRLPALRPDLAAGDDTLLSSLCQFDILASLATLTRGGDEESFYPSFAQFYADSSDPAVVTVIDDQSARQALYPRTDEDLANALLIIGHTARRQALPFAGWRGYQHPRILEFLQEHRPAHEAQAT